MKTKKEPRLKNIFLFLLTAIFTFLLIIPLQAQEKRDHRTKKNNNVRDHRVANKASVINQTLNFDEADAIFGKRTEIKKKYPTLKFTGKVNTINITQKVHEGDNSIHKTKSGYSLYATVKKGKIIGFGTVSDESSNTLVIAKMDNYKTCFNCTELCHYPADDGPNDCWTICEVVDCNSEHNARIQCQIAPNLKSTPPLVGPIPLPYPNISKLDSINPF